MKKFVAGANCPQCHSEDSLRVWSKGPMQFMDCIQCDFKQSIDNEAQTTSSSKLIGIKTIDNE